MKVILKSDVERLGKIGDTVTVAPGYARNFLLPKGMAVVANARNIELVELERKRNERAMPGTTFASVACCRSPISYRPPSKSAERC